MKIIADLHIHSHYSRATSEKMNVEELSHYASLKGLNLLGTGDFTHPLWFKELKEKLDNVEDGIYQFNKMNFILSSEISLIYLQNKKLRKVHLVVLSPSFEIVEQINQWLLTKGRLDYDGRPIFSMTCPEFTEKIMEISKDNFIVPAHAWTPWFGIFGSNSGFDSVEECFQDQTKNIHALETGLSSDPEMNWRLSSLDKYTLISNSDSHSPWSSRIGRECNVFELNKLTYRNLINAIKEKNPKRFLYTIEVDPAYGKYHFDGHRNCGIVLEPKEAIKMNNICPVCKRPLTIGVLHRVEELADREPGFVPKNAIPFKRLLPLTELIANKYKIGLFSKRVFEKEQFFIKRFGNELNVLLNAEIDELKEVDENLADTIIKNREGKIEINPGYDGVYGEPIINDKMLKKDIKKNNQNDLKRFLSQD
ncbi:MAG: endonuclease Q family protein [Candidatus Aenigmatarchaeota archaeon]